MSNNYFFSLFFLPILFLSAYTSAHDQVLTLPQTGVVGRAAIGYRDQGTTEDDELYLVPGAFLGGEATPVEKGFSLDDAQILGHYNSDDRYSVSAKINTHNHGGESSIELENLWLTWDIERLVPGSLVEVGRLASDVTYTANYHASESLFGEAPLSSDVFFGRHFNDVGLKVKSAHGPIGLGVEVWSGDTWPAANNEGAASIFLKYLPKWEKGSLSLGVWGMQIDAANRTDDRYDDGHDHGNSNLSENTGLIAFTGTTDMAGALLTVSHKIRDLTLSAEAEWIRAESSGVLRDEGGQQSGIESVAEGGRALLGVSFMQHEFILQYEEIMFENTFQDSVNVIFLNQTGLLNPGFNPNKLMASWLWQFHSDVKLRLEWIDDNSVVEEGSSRGTIGLVWSKKLF